MTRPLVSVCIVTYNQEEFIEQCLESVVKQCVDFEFEVIVSDDASTDRTPEIIKQFSERYPFVRPNLRDENVGAYINFVETHQLAQGELICHLDGDDYWLPEKLKTQTAFMLKNPGCAISWHRMKVLYPDGVMLDDNVNENLIGRKITQEILTQFISLGFHSSKMYRAKALFNVDVAFPVVDYLVNVEQLSKGYASFIGIEPLGVYRASIGIASDGSKTKSILSKSFSYIYKTKPHLRADVTTAALTLFLAAIKNKRFKDFKMFLPNVLNRFLLIALFKFLSNYSRSKRLRLHR